MTSLILCQGEKCPIRIYCLRYTITTDPYQDVSYFEFDSENLWCDYFIGEWVDEEKENKRKVQRG